MLWLLALGQSYCKTSWHKLSCLLAPVSLHCTEALQLPGGEETEGIYKVPLQLLKGVFGPFSAGVAPG